MRAIIAGGGTGGHVIPALAIAQELKARYRCELAFVGTARGMEAKLVPAAGYDLKLIEVGQLNRVSLATRLKTLLGLPLAILASWRILAEFKPDVVIGLLPAKGIPLPLISYGGSSLIVTLASIGVLLNISQQAE